MKAERVGAKATVLMLGYSYKANVGDIRFSPSATIFNQLQERNIKVQIYDPVAKAVVSESQRRFFVDDPYKAAEDADCLLVTVGHDAFKSLDFKSFAKGMRTPLFYDCTLSFDPERLRETGFKYKGVGRS